MSQSTENEMSGGAVVRPHEGGYAADGPGYYVWDEDPSEVLRAVRDLERGWFDTPPTRRFLLIKPNELAYESEPGDSESLPQ